MAGTILVTGGAGFIGSHACVALIESGYSVIVLDNLCNSSAVSLQRVEAITGTAPSLVEGDLRDVDCLDRVFASHGIDAVLHFGGLKAVGESVEKPLEYYDCNVVGALRLIAAMEKAGVKDIVFSSSATVYGDPESVPIRENFATGATNPYGRSKLMIEEMLADWHLAHPDWSVCRLRYFNPVGAHPSGLIGEDPRGIPNNLMPFIAQVAVGKRDKLSVFGNDYDTPDGTGVRDYIHVMDLVDGHVAALDYIRGNRDLHTFNLGTGSGYSVLQMIEAFASASGRDIPYEIVARRAGDIAASYADPAFARDTLGWRATRSLEDMCADTWRWQEANPRGFD